MPNLRKADKRCTPLMRHSLNIKILLIVFTSFQLGIDKSSLLYGQTSQEQSQLTIAYKSNKVDTSSFVISIDNLKVGQSYFINVESNGCFHHSSLYLTISKDTDSYFASFKMKGKIEGQKVNTKFKKTRLTNNQIDSVRNFERQLLFISSSKYDCTTVDEYTLSIGTYKRIYTVDNCDWQGIGKLVGALFRKSKYRRTTWYPM
jgi:hypothetical protein